MVIGHCVRLLDEFANYRGSLPNATFGSGKNSDKPKFALAKCLAYTICLMRILDYIWAKIAKKIALMK